MDSKRKADWQKLFSTSLNQSMEYFPPQIENGQVIVAPLEDIFKEGIDQWKDDILAQFIRRIPNFSYFQCMVNILWGAERAVDLRSVGSNLFIIRFSNMKT